MSTYFYYRCLQHDPPLKSREEVTQHDDDYLQHAIRLAQGAPWTEVEDYVGSYFDGNAKRFLLEHQTCPLDIVSEYGEPRPIPGRERTTG